MKATNAAIAATSLAIAFIFLLFGVAKGQTKQQAALDTAKALSQFTLEKWTVEAGMPSNSVMALTKTKTGYIWLATYDGLARYDGVQFKVYNKTTHPRFPTNSLLDLLEDARGNLWIATNGAGVLKMSGEHVEQIKSNTFLPNHSITSLAEDESGAIWVGTRGGLAQIRDGAYVEFVQQDRLRSLHIFTLYKDAKGSLWIGTVGEGLWELQNGVLRQYNHAHGLNNNSVRSIHEDDKGRLWIGTEEGIYQMQFGKIKEVQVFNAPFSAFVNDIHQDAFGTLWFATNDGLLRYKNGIFDFLQPDPEGGANELQNLFSDGEGSLWIGTYYAGLIRLRDGKFNNYATLEGLPNEVVNVIWPENNGAWIGTNGGLAFVRNGVENVYLLDNHSSANRIRDIFRDTKGVLWIATNDGIFQMKGQKFERVLQKGAGLASDKIRRIVEDKSGSIWIGTRSGLYYQSASKPKEVSVVDELSGVFILSLYVDSKNNLWVGTNGKGLFHYDGYRFKRISTVDGLSSDVIFDICEDREGNIWVCSNAGLNVLKDHTWYTINEQQGLFVNTVFQIIADKEDRFWLTTHRGIFSGARADFLAVLNGEQDQLSSLRHFSTSDGMRSSEITSVSVGRVAPSGVMWFATLKGASALDPKRLAINETLPKVKIEQIVADKKEYVLEEQVFFPAGTRQYEFHYTAFHYYAPDALNFKYKLEGFDHEWQEAGNRRVAYYTNLPKGYYRFKVMAANEDGVWSETGAEQLLVQEAYLWETLLFKVGVVFILLVLLLIIYFWRIHQLHHKNLRLEKLVDERTLHISRHKEVLEKQKEELSKLNQLKDKLLSVLSHDLRQPFTSISCLLTLLREQQINQPEFQKFSTDLNQQVKWQVHMLDNVLLWVHNQLSGLEVKPVDVNLYQHTEEVLMLYRTQATAKNINLQNTIPTDMIITADAEIIHLVLRNLVGNAVKFTPENGNITINARVIRNHLKVEVCDDGVGIEKEKLSHIFEAQFQSER